MKTIPSAGSYRELLKATYETRKRNNPRYSMRAFARDLGLTAPRLSHVLNGDHGISPEAASRLTKKLGLNEAEARHFVLLVESEHARGSKSRQVAKASLGAMPDPYRDLSLDAFAALSDPLHFTLLEALALKSAPRTEAELASRVERDVLEIRLALERLARLEAIESLPSGGWRPVADFVVNSSAVPSSAIRDFHRALLKSALRALEEQGTDERDFSNLVFALDTRSLPKARERIREFRVAMDEEFGLRAARKDEVYALSLQLFRLTKKGKSI